jgi:hypothetical protein
MSRSGRPKVLAAGRSINVIVPAEDFHSLRRHVEQIKRDQPGFSMGDLVRDFIRAGMAGNKIRTVDPDPLIENARHLRVAARIAARIARQMELSSAAGEGSSSAA